VFFQVKFFSVSSNKTANNQSTTSSTTNNNSTSSNNDKLEEQLDNNEERILGTVSTILDMSYESMNSNRSRQKIEKIQNKAMDKYNEKSELSSEIKDTEGSNIPIAKLIALDAQNEACKHLTASVTEADKIVRNTYASGDRD
jgi:hypothetical protein